MANLTDTELKELFHKVWGEAHDGNYNKYDWLRLQIELAKRGIDV
jgi:hypothetical protein